MNAECTCDWYDSFPQIGGVLPHYDFSKYILNLSIRDYCLSIVLFFKYCPQNNNQIFSQFLESKSSAAQESESGTAFSQFLNVEIVPKLTMKIYS